MAANSGGGVVDWNTMIKPLVTYSLGSLSRQETVTLVKAIVDSEKELLESATPEHGHSVFYDVVTVLAAHVITAAAEADLIPRSSYPLTCQAARIICESLLNRMSHILKSPHPVISVKIFISAIQEFCTGHVIFSEEETGNILSVLRTTELPPKILSTAPSSWDKEGTTAAVKEVRRNRLDPSVLLFDQISMPVISMPPDVPVSELLAQEVTRIFQTLRAGQKFVELILSFPGLKNFVPSKVVLTEEAIRKSCATVQVLKNPSADLTALTEELNLVFRFMAPALFAPLSTEDSFRLNQLALASLNVAFAVMNHFYGNVATPMVKSSSSSNLSENEYPVGVMIVAQSIWTQKQVVQIFKENTGIPQWSWLNCCLALSKTLFISLHSYMRNVSPAPEQGGSSLKPSDVRDGTTINMATVQQLWNELATSLVTHGVQLVQSFISLLSIGETDTSTTPKLKGHLSNFQNELQLSSTERIQGFFEGSVNVIELLVQIITLSYRRACRLKLATAAARNDNSGPSEGDNKALFSTEDDSNGNNLDMSLEPNTLEIDYTNDAEAEGDNNSVSDLMTTEDEDERDDENEGELDRSYDIGEYDDEPFLGKWLQSVLNPPETLVEDSEVRSDKKSTNEGAGADEVKSLTEKFIPEKDCAGALIKSALTALRFLTKDIVCSSNATVKSLSSTSFTEQTAALLALILIDLDQEKSNAELGAISSVFDESLNRTFYDFSAEMGKLVQNLLAQKILSASVQQCLLDQLGVDLGPSGRWYLGLQPRALAVLVQVVLLKAQDKESLVVQILKRVLETICEDISTPGSPPAKYADLPVEHAQTLVFLFHTLSLMQKKAIMIDTARAVITVSNRLNGRIQDRHQLSSLSRLLLIFDYFIRQLYEPSLSLISQVQYNLFNDETSAGSASGQGQSWGNNKSSGKSALKKKSSSSLSSDNVPVTEQGSTSGTPSTTAAGATTAAAATTENQNGIGSGGVVSWNEKALPPARLYYDSPIVGCDEGEKGDIRPKFYNLIRVEPNYQENPRLDGLAMNFLMNKNDVNFKDKMAYSEVIEAILRLVELRMVDTENKATQQYIQYFLSRLLFGLPPPHEFLIKLEESAGNCDWLSDKPALVLYLMIWLPRLQNRIYSSWIRDIFSKQGLTTTQSEELAKRTGVSTFSSSFVVPFLQAASRWIPRASSQIPVYFFAVEAALVFAHENMEEYLTPESSPGSDANKKEEEITSIFRNILHATLDAIRTDVCCTEFSSKHKSKNFSLATCIKSTSHLLAIGSGFLAQNSMAKVVNKYMDPDLAASFQKFLPSDFAFDDQYPEFNVKKFSADIIPGESYLLTIVNGHAGGKISQMNALKHLLCSVVKLCGAGINGKNGKKVAAAAAAAAPEGRRKELQELLYPLLLDRVAEFMAPLVGQCIDPIWTKSETPMGKNLTEIFVSVTLRAIVDPELRAVIPSESQAAFMEESVNCLMSVLENNVVESVEIVLDKARNGQMLADLFSLIHSLEFEGVVEKLCNYLSMILDTSPVEQEEICKFFKKNLDESPSVSSAEKSAGNVSEKPGSALRIEKLPAKLFRLDLFKSEKSVEASCKFLGGLAVMLRLGDKSTRKVIVTLLTSTLEVLNENLKTLKSPEDLTGSFPHVLRLLIKLAGQAEGPEGHTPLFRQMTSWFFTLCENLDEELCEAVGEDSAKPPWLQSITIMTDYMLDVGKALQAIQNNLLVGTSSSSSRAPEREGTPGSVSPPNETEDNFDLCDSEGGEEAGGDDEDSGGEDSDDEGLNSRLCTYTITQKEFMSQHWYHCHTCDMTDGVGVCSVCARVCHKGHDVTYAKFGSFFCDCGAKTDGSCGALVRRLNNPAGNEATPAVPPAAAAAAAVPEVTNGNSYNPFVSATEAVDNRRASSPTNLDAKSTLTTATILFRNHSAREWSSDVVTSRDLAKREGQLKGFNFEEIMEALKEFSVKLPRRTIDKLVPVVHQLADLKTPVGAYLRVRSALDKLRNGEEQLVFSSSEDLVIPTLGSQEGAFENIKMQYNGDQGSTIRQLINTQVVRRSTIAALSAPAARRNYLAVSQEKGKLTILQLGALLSGAEVGKKKLTLPRLATVTLPFTALTMATNPLRDDVIAVCGLKDCHVLVIGTGGTITSHFVLQPQLESQNHIIKPVWIPGSQTELAILTSDAVKIYDLARDTISPIFYFLLPTGKVRDATFVVQDKYRYIVIMSFEGRIFYEKLSDVTSASHGYYYVTNDLNFQDTEMLVNENNSASLDSKGVSLYYSHALKLLFYTYPNGKSYVGTLDDLEEMNNPLSKGVLITPKAAGKPASLGLAQWTEVLGHPGLIFAMGYNSVPYVLLMTEKGSYIQEIRMVGKIKPVDIVAIRHMANHGKMKTSLLILCDDGSLRVCDASESTEFWLNPKLRPHQDLLQVKPFLKKGISSKRLKQVPKCTNGKLIFPVDFFEHCQPIQDVEFGGNDLLQTYNAGQIRNRLNSPGMYIVATKSSGFNLEISCNDGSMVITGIRVLLGSQDVSRAPSYIQVFGRSVPIAMTRTRWYDVPFTREESIQAESKISVTFGPSSDPQCATFVDSVKVYGKTKDSFGWPEDSDDIVAAQAAASAAIPVDSSISSGGTSSARPLPGTAQNYSIDSILVKRKDDELVERVVTNVLEMCEIAVTVFSKDLSEPEVLSSAVSTVTSIYLENYPPVSATCRSFLSTVMGNKTVYYEHKDKALFSHCISKIVEMISTMKANSDRVTDVDPESFRHIVTCVKNIAVVRPQHIIQFDYAAFNKEQALSINLTDFVTDLVKIFGAFVNQRPDNPHIVAVDRPGIQRVEAVAMCLADIIYSLMISDISLVDQLSAPLFDLLLSPHKDLSVPVRQLFTKRLRPKNMRKRRVTVPGGPSPPHCTSPDTAAESPREVSTPSGGSSGRNIVDPANIPLVEVDEPIVMLGQDNDAQMPILNPLDAFMGADGFMAPGIDLQSDAEDEAMVELAIALSLQEQVGGAALAIQGIQEGLQALEDMHQEVLHVAEAMSPPEDEPEHLDGAVEGGAESDATASPPPSDDEGSTVATEGSTMRNSEPGGSESSGSSGGGGSVRGRSHSSGGGGQGQNPSASSDATRREGRRGDASKSKGSDKENVAKNPSFLFANAKPFRLGLMKVISDKIVYCSDPLTVIPLLQVLLVIITELDGSSVEERSAVENMVNQLLRVIKLEEKIKLDREWERDVNSEITLISLRMLSILVSRWRQPDIRPENNWISRITAEIVYRNGLVQRCKDLLHVLRSTWKGSQEAEDAGSSSAITAVAAPAAVIAPLNSAGAGAEITVNLLKPSVSSNPPDYGPFFLKQYVKSHCHDILEELPLLLSEMALRFPYQVKKIINQEAVFDSDWEELLCEMLQNRNAPFVRRQARKLLLNIAGTRENYHLLRDLHNIKFNLNEFKRLIGFEGNSDAERFAKASKMEFKYSQLVSMVEHLNTCIDIATQRPASWQTYCKNEDALEFIIQMSGTADESLTTAILTLLKIAIDGVPFESKNESVMLGMSEDEKALKSLAHQIIDNVEKRAFLEFVKKYLLEHPVLTTRWQAHALLLGFFLTSDCAHQLKLVNALWELWPFVPAAGVRAAQFVDILGYATLNNDHLKSTDLRQQVSHCISSIESQGNSLLAHPNANIYSSLVPFVSVEGFYLESEPCEVCYNIDKPYTTQKLATIKADAKFTGFSQIFKLASTLSVIRLSIRLTEVKKARMIKNMVVYYSAKNLPIVELKNKPNLWQMARRVVLSPSQTEIKLDFSVPITAANIMLEFLEFYENVQATSETLQCPRCSASVPAQPGVCSNCGENVFQCHKCRAINYDERDPFLCHSCGFCKYAKMDITVLAKNVVAVDPIENEEDHKKAETAVSSLLEKADQTYKQQQQMKGCLETMMQSIKERRSMAGVSTGTTTLSSVSSSGNAVGINLGSVQAPQSYAAVAAVANALNNNVQVPTGGSNGGAIAGVSGTQVLNAGSGVGASSSLVLKNVQSLAYCYAIDCKNSYEELNRLMRKVWAYRKEMLKLDPTSYSFDTMDNITYRRCYGCMASSITLSLKLLQALITAGSPRDPFDPYFLSFLLRLSQSAGSTALKEQVKNALCFFVKDDSLATIQLTDMITSRVMAALNKETWSDVSFETSEEISLLASLLQMYDSCWEIKLRSLMGIFTHAINRLRDPRVTETGLLPCLKIIQNFIRATSADKEKVTVAPVEAVTVNLEAWMKGDENYSFEMWKKRLPKVKKSGGSDGKLAPASEAPPGPTSSVVKERKKGEGRSKRVATAQGEAFIQALLSSAEGKITNKKEGGGTPAVDVHENYLMKTYGRVWLDKFFKLDTTGPLQFDSEFIWIKKLIFCPGSVQTRAVTAALLKDLAQIPQRRLKIMELLTSFMEDLPTNGESCREFMELYRDLATPAEFSAFLNAKGALNIVCKLLDEHIEKLHYLEAVTMHSDLSQGIAVWELSRLLSALAIPSVRRNRRVSLLSTVLGGYLALKRLRLHRTRPIEEAQDILLQLLEEITSGTEEETKIFMSVCVETLKKCHKDDLTTPVFVFERLCSLIVHEENEVAEFFVSLDKDPQQEDFLQGRMLGNPYSSNETGIGPLMRDIKNKICTDCELVALLEDDNGMELLVNNKIISLDLPVKEVYKRIWLPTNGQIEPMRIVYRMRGLLGDATEEFVESFASPTEGPEDNEATYKLANVLVDCGGLRVVLNSLENLLNQQFVMPRAKPLIAVILKLLSYSAKIKRGREALLNPDLNAVQILLPILRLCLQFELTCIQGSSGVVHLTDQVLEILEIVLTDACALDEVAFRRFAKSRGSLNDIRNLLQLTQKLKNKPTTMITYLKVLACLTYTEKDKMMEIFEYYSDCWSFFNFDNDPNPDFATKLEQMCTLVSNIQAGPFGATLKDLAIERQAVELCLEYIRLLAPSLKPPMGRPDSDEWKEMVSKPSLKYVLRLLAGFAANHAPTQEALKDSIYVIHQLEQVSSDEHVGSLAENALEALRSHEKIWKEVEGARRATREEKKRMAMAMRERQLSTMGMKTNDKGQVTAAVSTMLDQMEELAEETGLICVICREGYKYQPTKVLGIYTFSKRCLLEEHELKSRKTYGYCTVSHFNVVHVDCHMAAIRLARSRDEWESASLQNTNTRCNGLIPLWGQQVPESAFAACLARHNAYLQEATGSRDVGFSSGVHDIKLLLLRFAEEKTFHEDTGGGGPESNMHLIPYLIHTALYVLNTTRGAVKESRNVEIFLFLFTHLWKEDAYAVEGVCYHMVVSLLVNHPDKWMQNRVQWLKRILGMCAVRCKKNRAASFEHFRSGLIFLCLIHGLYTVVFKDIGGTGEWPSMLADFIRKNDEPLMKTTSTLLSLYQQKLLTAKSYKDFLDILGISEDPVLRELDDFMTKLWDEMNMP